MNNTSPFKIIVLGITIVLAVFSILVFSGRVPFFTGTDKNATKFSGKVMIWGSLPENQMKEYLSNFTADKIGYSIDYKQIQVSQFKSKLAEALSVGYGPDIIIANHDVILSNEYYLQPIKFSNTLTENQYKSTYVDAASIFVRSGGIVAFPVGIDPMIMFYNKDLQNQLGIINTPTDWNIMLKTAENNTKNGSIAGIFEASILPLGAYDNYDYNKDLMLTLVNQLGGETIKVSGDGFVGGFEVETQKNGPTYIDSSVRYMSNFSNPSLKSFTWSPRMRNALIEFTAGKLLYYPAYISDQSLISNLNSKLNFDYVFMPQVPDHTTIYTGSKVLGIAMLSSSKNPTAAYDALTSFGYNKDFANQIAAMAGEPSPRKDTLAGVGSSQYPEIVGKSILVAKPFYEIDKDKSNALVNTMFRDIYANRKDITDALHIFVKSLYKMYNINAY